MLNVDAFHGRTQGEDVLFLSVAIGDAYKRRYVDVFFESHRLYCLKHGYDLLVIDDFIDRENIDRSLLTYQKYALFFGEIVQKYKWVLFVDADVLINAVTAPPITAANADPAYVSFVDEFTQPTFAERMAVQRAAGWETSGTEYYRSSGFEFVTDSVLNGGVMFLNVARHGAIMRDIYATGRTYGRNHPRGVHFEQALVGYAFHRVAAVKVIDNRWNALMGIQAMARGHESPTKEDFFWRFFHRNYFIHLANKAYLGLETEIVKANDWMRQRFLADRSLAPLLRDRDAADAFPTPPGVSAPAVARPRPAP